MKTNKYLALIALLLFAFANAYGQSNLSLDKTIEYAESVRDLNGEKSEEYLKALDSVVQVAFLTNNQEVRYAYRSQHVGILEAMKGKNNRDYVNALWSLGYACEAIGDTTSAMGHYQECLSLLEKMMEVDESNETADFYIKCVYYVFRNYCASGDFEKADSLVEVLIQTTERVDGKFSCHYFGMLQEGAMVATRLNKLEDFVRYSTLTIDNDKEIDSCNYTYFDQAYQNLMIFYSRNNQVDRSLELANNYLQRLTSAGNGFIHEKANALFWLSSLSSSMNIDYSVEYGKRAEQLLKAYYNNQDVMFQDPIYFPIVNNLAYLSDQTGNYNDAVYYYSICCRILAGKGLQNTKDYYQYLFHLFLAADRSDNYQLALKVSKDLNELIPLFANDINNDSYLFVNRMCNIHMHLLDFNEAMLYCDKMIEMEENVLQDTIRLAKTLSTKAELHCNLGNVEKAIETISIGKALLNNHPVSSESLSAKSMLLSLESQIIPNNLELSISKIDSALYLDKEVVKDIVSREDSMEPYLYNIAIRNAYSSYAIDLQRKGDLYNGYSSRKAKYYFCEAAKLIEKCFSKNSVEYVNCMLSLADCQIVCYEYTEALNTLQEIKPYLLEIYGENSSQYADYLAICAEYYMTAVSSQKAMEYNIESAKINKLLDGEQSPRYAYDLGRIGFILNLNHHYEEAADTLNKALTIMNSIEGNTSVRNYIKDELAHAWYFLGSYDKADSLYREKLHSEEELYGKYSQQVAGTLDSWGYNLYYNKADAVAFDYFSEAIAIYDSLGISDNGAHIINLLARYVESGLVFNKELDTTLLDLITKNYKNLYNRYVTYYSTNDREKLVRHLYPTNNVYFNLLSKYPIEKTLFEIELFSKSILLTTSQHFQQAVMNSGRQDLIEQYNDIQSIQMTIDNHSFGLSSEDLSTEDLNERKTSMERDLIVKMKKLGYSSADSLSYTAVANSLKQNEVAIEFVDYHHYLKGIPSSLQNERIKELMLDCDKTYYGALLVKSSWDKPVYVQLCTEDELKACLGNPNVTYSTDDLYRLLWQPLLEYVGDCSTVYFSPSGMLHTIALESIHTPNGSCLSDKYNLVRLTSTRELCKAKQPKTYETGAIYGGLQYDVEQQRMAEVAAMNKTELEESPAFALRGEDRGNWNYLPGTLAEAEHIAGIMRQANIGCGLYEGDLGSEESFKALSGGHNDIIHLATHGYFIEGEKADMNDFMNSLSPLARQKADSVIDPLLRSGLILSGGNNAWLGKEVPEGIEDGVLTALEISTMNLSGTDMVVMSACETGLGDITSDGVFGLQRAFKMAGVQTLVMSLWKVDDNATSLMMQTFYEQLLSGKTKREAFNVAQAAVRAKYPEPYYWAGFVMLD